MSPCEYVSPKETSIQEAEGTSRCDRKALNFNLNRDRQCAPTRRFPRGPCQHVAAYFRRFVLDTFVLHSVSSILRSRWRRSLQKSGSYVSHCL